MLLTDETNPSSWVAVRSRKRGQVTKLLLKIVLVILILCTTPVSFAGQGTATNTASCPVSKQEPTARTTQNAGGNLSPSVIPLKPDVSIPHQTAEMIEDFCLRSPACKMAAAGVLLSLIFLVSDIAVAQAQGRQWCYVCHATPFSNDCMSNPDSLLDSRLEVEYINGTGDNSTDPKTVSNVGFCPPSLPYCTIEEIVVDNTVKLFYRDCSDGERFSVAINGTRLDNPKPDNITHCAFVLQFMGQVCVTLCSGHFCNGPNNAGTTLGTHWSPMYLLLVYVLAKYAL